jgi:hypothetical protein
MTWSRGCRTTIAATTIRWLAATSVVLCTSAKAQSDARSAPLSVEILEIDPTTTDLTVSTVSDIQDQYDVRLEMRRRDLAASFRDVVRKGLICNSPQPPAARALTTLIRFRYPNNGDESYVGTRFTIESLSDHCWREIDDRLRRMLSSLMLTNDVYRLAPKKAGKTAPNPPGK